MPLFKKSNEFAGKRVLITGAGHGLGRELAVAFAQAGAEVVVTDRDPGRVSETTIAIREAGGKAVGYPLDVTDETDVHDVHDRLLTEHGPIDILVNNAGVVYGGEFLDVPLQRHRMTYEINTLGPMVMTYTFLPNLLDRPDAHIVNVSSASALVPLPYATTYASSKWGLLGFSDSIREELRLQGHKNVHVTTVCPSYIGTGMFQGVKLPRWSRHLQPSEVAQMTLRAVSRCQETLLSPWFVKITPLCKATMPRRLFRWMCDILHINSGMTSWRGHAPEPQVLARRLGSASAAAVRPESEIPGRIGRPT